MNGHRLAEQFSTFAKQDHAARLGMWGFLGSEVTLFGGLFALYAAYRAMYGHEFVAAVGHNNLAIGTINTLILLTSSFTVALTVWAARAARSKLIAPLLGLTILLGCVFLLLKGIEWSQHFHQGILPGLHYRNREMQEFGAKVFFTLYFIMTGLHAIHVVIGIAVLGWFAVQAGRRLYTPEHHVTLEMATLYWHLVDIVWIFLWPAFYLMRG